ncbi:hypothetical protein [Qipengyuania sp. RANM35]|uniref:hypothetical protein n=1 Tax=Qipengyuania sp. RANM35 TaxID=3068635 RepID=UPI0034DAEF79
MATPPIRLVAEKRVARYFLGKGATSAADAIAYEPDLGSRKRAFDRLKGLDIVRSGGRDRWFLDEARWAELRSQRRGRMVTMLAVGAAIAAFVVTR